MHGPILFSAVRVVTTPQGPYCGRILIVLFLFACVAEVASAEHGAKIRAGTASAAVHLQTQFHHRTAQGDLCAVVGMLPQLLCYIVAPLLCLTQHVCLSHVSLPLQPSYDTVHLCALLLSFVKGKIRRHTCVA